MPEEHASLALGSSKMHKKGATRKDSQRERDRRRKTSSMSRKKEKDRERERERAKEKDKSLNWNKEYTMDEGEEEREQRYIPNTAIVLEALTKVFHFLGESLICGPSNANRTNFFGDLQQYDSICTVCMFFFGDLQQYDSICTVCMFFFPCTHCFVLWESWSSPEKHYGWVPVSMQQVPEKMVFSLGFKLGTAPTQ